MSSKKPPKRRLSRDAVLDAAMDLLDEEGLDALTMRSLADRLDVVPMALYRHVENKDDLVDGLLDRAVSQVPLPDPKLGWREGLAALARAMRATMLAHPAVVGPVVNRPTLGPSSLKIGEYAFSVLLADGLTGEQCERALNLVLTYTLGFVALEVPRTSPHGDAQQVADKLNSAYREIPAAAYPHTAEVGPDPTAIVSADQFDFGLDCVLDGISAAYGIS